MNQYNDTRQVYRSELAAATDAFFRSGGKIEHLAPPTFEPRPSRTEPVISPEELEYRAFVEKVREMGKTMNKTKIVQALGVTDHQVYTVCKQHGIICKPLRNNGSGHGCVDPKLDAPLVERLRALAEIGIRKSLARAQIGLTWHVTERLVKTYGIEFKQ